MTSDSNPPTSPATSSSPSLPSIPAEERERLFTAAAELWEEFRRERAERFHSFIPADYALAYEALRRLRPRADTFLELGAGVGVIAILAARLGFEACAIEIDPALVERGEELADEFDARVVFAQGSYVPASFQARFDAEREDFLTIDVGQPAYSELGHDLDDFDLVYIYPWPDTEDLHVEMLDACMRPDALRMLYDGTEGFRIASRSAPEFREA